MKFSPRYLRTHLGFSTLELMIVISIVIVVIAILVPTVGGMKRSAGAAGCVNHLRQIGVGIQQYIAEQNGKLPPEPGLSLNAFLIDTLRSMTPAPGANVGYVGALAISGGPKVDWWICPNDPSKGGWRRFGAANGIPGENEAERGVNAHSYSFNVALAYRRITEITRPSQSILMVDFPWGQLGTRGIWPGGASWTNALPNDWHNNGVNCLFVDGSVKAIPADTLALGKRNAYLWYADYPSSGITPKIRY